jgi:hypothetical protein
LCPIQGEAAADEGKTGGLHILKLSDTRWLSVLRSLKNAWRELPALVGWLQEQAATGSEPTAVGLLRELTDADVIAAMVIYMPLLDNLSFLSKVRGLIDTARQRLLLLLHAFNEGFQGVTYLASEFRSVLGLLVFSAL